MFLRATKNAFLSSNSPPTASISVESSFSDNIQSSHIDRELFIPSISSSSDTNFSISNNASVTPDQGGALSYNKKTSVTPPLRYSGAMESVLRLKNIVKIQNDHIIVPKKNPRLSILPPQLQTKMTNNNNRSDGPSEAEEMRKLKLMKLNEFIKSDIYNISIISQYFKIRYNGYTCYKCYTN